MFDAIHPNHTTDAPQSDETAVVPSVSITNLLNMRQGVASRLQQACALFIEAKAMAEASHLGFPRLSMSNRELYGKDTAEQLLQVFLPEVDGEGWNYLMKESGLLTFMDSKARADWSERVHEHKVPELTAANIEATFTNLYDNRNDMLERGVLEVFKGLSWDYKTNLPHKFGKKLIVSHIVSSRFKDLYYFSSSRLNALDDLDRVFHKLDKKPEPDHRNGWYVRLETTTRTGPAEVSGPYFSVRWFKKGTAHVTFHNLAMVEQLNKILSKHFPNALPPVC